MTTSWDEIKQLAADFQRTQLSDASQKLNERNCIEIVRKIIQLGLIEVYFTTDGREYLTPSHLLNEIENELYANNGRVYITDLVHTLQIDVNLIEQKANELTKQSGGQISYILGQLISNEFKDQVAAELNERLQTKGTMTLSEMVKSYDFPPDFLQGLVASRLKSIIQAVQDPNDPQIYFTEAFFNMHKSKIIGVLNAITKPTSLSQICSTYKFPTKIFQTVMTEVAKEKKVPGTITLGNQGIFTPEIYQRAQQEWLDNFLSQNSYVEFEALQRIGVPDAKGQCKKRENLILLKTCAVKQFIYDQIESLIYESIKENMWLDLSSIVPTVLSNADIQALFDLVIEKNRSLSSSISLINCFVLPNNFIESLLSVFETKLKEKVNQDLSNGNLSTFMVAKSGGKSSRGDSHESGLSRKEERKRQNAGKQKSGGGAQGREVKIRSTKKKYNRKDDFNSDEEEGNMNARSDNLSENLGFLTRDEIVQELSSGHETMNEAPELMVDELADILFPKLKEKYLQLAIETYNEQLTSSSSTKKTHAEVNQTLNQLFSSIVMCQQGTKICQSSDLQAQLEKYLLKSLCTEFVNTIISYASTEENVNLTTFESRQKYIKKLPTEFINSFNRLNTSLNLATCEEFLVSVNDVIEKLDFMLKPVDKKREKQLIVEGRVNLQSQLAETNDAVLALHLSVLIMFISLNQQLIHASGKFVPQILAELRSKLDDTQYSALSQCEQLVVRKFKKDTSTDEKQQIEEQLEQILPKIKQIACKVK